MQLLKLLALAMALAHPAAAGEVTITDAYARSASPSAMTGAAFFTIENQGTAEDRLIAIRTPAAERAEIHTHIEDTGGIMRMIKVEDGIVIPAGGTHKLMRGGDHVMFLGLTAPFEQGALIPVTLIFEQTGEITIDIPVDLHRAPEPMHGHSG